MIRPRSGAVAAAVAIAALAGCGGAEDPPAPPRPAATATPISSAAAAPAAPRAPRGTAVRFEAADGRPVTGRYRPAGRHAPGVVLLHEIRGDVDQWDPLAGYLHDAGFATLAYRSRGSLLERERLPDAIAAIRWLRSRPGVDRRRIALVGASIGASTTVLAMATRARRTADAAVALSPPDSPDIWALQDDGRYRPHDMLLVSDERESSSAEGMLAGAIRSKVMRSADPGHGVALLGEQRVRDALLDWLEERLG
jgi:cephalosporin-C deacetylase-like acetyl esterase